jgi:sugar-specific transcriptional regulator TrmB
MQTDAHLIRNYFAKLGFEPEIADIYLALHTHGPQSISELARHSGVERTRIYRLLGPLTDSNLIEIDTLYKSSLYRAAPITNLRILISRREQDLEALHTGLGAIEQVLARNTLTSPATRVQFYRGEAGIKQMFWNETKAQSEVTAILYENMQIKTNNAFFERWVEKCNRQGLRFRGLISEEFVNSQQTWYAMHHNERLAHWTPRYLSKADFPIRHSTVIYDDVVANYNWKDDEIFGIETHNQDIAETQRQLFNMLWERATPVDDLTIP